MESGSARGQTLFSVFERSFDIWPFPVSLLMGAKASQLGWTNDARLLVCDTAFAGAFYVFDVLVKRTASGFEWRCLPFGFPRCQF